MDGQVDREQTLTTKTVSILLDTAGEDGTVAQTTTVPLHVFATDSGADMSALTTAQHILTAKPHATLAGNTQEGNSTSTMPSESCVVFLEPGTGMDLLSAKDPKSTVTSCTTGSGVEVSEKQEQCIGSDRVGTATTTGPIPLVISGSGSGADSLTTVSVKSELSPSSLSTPLMTETAVLVETPRGLMLSVGDEVRAVTYSSLTDGAETQGDHMLSIGNSCIPVALLSQCQQAMMEESGEGVVFEGVVDGDQTVTSHEGSIVSSQDMSLVGQQVHTVSSTPDTEEPKKKNRGWPKGKRRKAVPEVHGPRAPMTGYVLFAINRRQQIKQSHPQLPFTEVTKILGQEWSCMPSDKKQKYLDEAEIDKQRYIDELKEFQKSDMYQTLVKKKRLKENDAVDDFGTCPDTEEEVDELYCRVCNLYFSSLHNKKEHMFGRQHLQAITDQLERELKKQQKEQELAQQASNITATGHLSPQQSVPLSELRENVEESRPSRPVDISTFIVEFVQKNYERDQEISTLRRILRKDVQENWTICKQIQELKEYESKLRQDVKTLTSHTSSLSTQINSLKTVPALFGVVEF